MFMSLLEGIFEPTRPTLRHGTSSITRASLAPTPVPPGSGVSYQPGFLEADLPPTYTVPTIAPAGTPSTPAAAPSLTAAQMLARAVYGMVADAGVSGRWTHDLIETD
jgi:hypothetical protein